MAQQIADLTDDQAGLTHVALFLGLAQVLPNGIRDRLLVTNEGPTQPFQRLDPPLHRQGSAGVVIAPLLFHNRRDLFSGHTLSSLTWFKTVPFFFLYHSSFDFLRQVRTRSLRKIPI